MKSVKKLVRHGVSDVILLGVIIVSVFPFLYMFLMSFKSTINAFDFDFSPDKLTLEQYVKVFPGSVFAGWLCVCKDEF